MKKEDIVIGTTYRIRKWDDMVAEHGLDDEGNVVLNEDTYFSPAMKHLCGTSHTVIGFDADSDDDCLPDVRDSDGWRCGVSAEMLEPLP